MHAVVRSITPLISLGICVYGILVIRDVVKFW